MKKVFTLMAVASMAMLTYAQNPKQVRKTVGKQKLERAVRNLNLVDYEEITNGRLEEKLKTETEERRNDGPAPVAMAPVVKGADPIITTKTATLPYNNTFDTKTEQDECGIYDANGDGRTFAPYNGEMRYYYNSQVDADDYLVMPGVQMKAGKSYKIVFDARVNNSSYPETFSLLAGTKASVSGLNITVIPETTINNKQAQKQACWFKPEADGTYFFAIHCTSPAYMYYLFIDNFSIQEAADGEDTDTDIDTEPALNTFTAEVPYFNGIDNALEQAQISIYDANGDNRTFTFYNDGNGQAARYMYSSYNKADDYLIFPGIQMEAGKAYTVSFDVRCASDKYNETFEFLVGDKPKISRLKVIIPETSVKNTAYKTHSIEFVPEKDGFYTFACRVTSEKYQDRFFFDNFRVELPDQDAPATVENLVVEGDAAGLLKATAKFTTPATSRSGNALTSVKTVLARNGVIVAEAINPAGTEVEMVDENVPADGMYEYSVTAMSEDGQSVGGTVTTKAFVGEDVPVNPTTFLLTDNVKTVGVEWNAVTNGVNNQRFIPENVTYNIYGVGETDVFGHPSYYIDYSQVYASGVKGTSVEIPYNTTQGPQDYTYFALTAQNKAGESSGVATYMFTGANYALPFHESFDNNSSEHFWETDMDEGNAYDDGGVYYGQENINLSATTNGWLSLISGRIAPGTAQNIQMTFDYRGADHFEVMAWGPNKKTAVKTYASEWATRTGTFDLSELADEPWLRFEIKGVFKYADEAYIDNINVIELIDNDLAVTLSAPETLVMGNTANIVAKVRNNGQNTVQDYTVNFYANDELIATVNPAAIEKQKTIDIKTSYKTTIFDEADDIIISAEVVCDTDEKDVNNYDEVIMTVTEPNVNPVASLDANLDGNWVKLKWTVEENSTEEILEDFENIETASYGTGAVGRWTAIDDDGIPYIFNEEAGVNWPYNSSYAFAIVDPAENNLADAVSPASGNQLLWFMANSSGQNDDWLISPMLPGIAQTISFKVQSYTTQYGNDQIEVLASSTTNDKDAFTSVKSYIIDFTSWQTKSVNLPEGTKYFAIRFVSNDTFACFLDDIAFKAGAADPTGFNIYVDHNLVGTVNADARTFTINPAGSASSHSYSVSALYGSTESAAVTAYVSETDAIQNINANSNDATIYSINGARVNKATQSGVYVVNGQKVVIK